MRTRFSPMRDRPCAFAVFWVAGRLRRQADRADLMNTIEDFRGWRSADAAHRSRGCIRRLNALQTTRLGVRS
ncbi:MAG: hypothetical protein U5J82_15075 [Desulfobacterales bacterium]|nr:hypothetical protein [Desulfobacterales bacterium]